MPVGLETFLPDGQGVQFTNDVPIISLFRQGVMSTSDGGWSSESGNSGFKDVTFSIPEAQTGKIMVALRSQRGVWSQLLSRSGAAVTIRFFLVGSGSLQYFIYSDAPPPENASKMGLEMYHQGRRIYASDYQPMLPLGVFSGQYNSGTYSGVPLSGRRIAFVPVKMYSQTIQARSYSGLGGCYAGGGIPGWQEYVFDSWTRSALVAFEGSIEVFNRAMSVGPYPTSCALSQPFPVVNSTTYMGFKALVVDVTTLVQ